MPNRLARETSPYLQQHAQNPVDWYPWGPEALERAKREDKPILLSIGYSACHWCHVMERESFENEATARVMNEWFVSVKVDREERPDLDQVYQLVVQLMGRNGGWPLTVFLTPDQRPFFGGHVLSARRSLRDAGLPEGAPGGPGGLPRAPRRGERAGRGADAGHPARRHGRRRGDRRRHHPGLSRARGAQALVALRRPARRLRAAAQVPEHDGPRRCCCGPATCARVRKALDAMRAGGIWDHLGGGFHRYSTDERWLVPHFEKMLYDNALLLRLYVDAWRATGEPLYERDGAGDRRVRRAGDDGPGGRRSTRRRTPTARARRGSSSCGRRPRSTRRAQGTTRRRAWPGPRST